MTDWSLVLGVLALGLVLGGVLVLFLGRRDAAASRAAVPATLRDLVAERDLLIARLRELDLERLRDPEEVAAERWELELRAARVLREIDRLEREARAAASAPESPHERPLLRGFFWGLGTAAFLALLLVLVARFAQDRPQPPGAAMAQAAEEIDPELLGLIDRVRQDPQNREARLDLISVLLARERYVDAWPFIQQVAAEAPDEPRVWLYEATVREAMGQLDRARALLDRTVAGAPQLTEAWVRRGLVSFAMGDWAVAAESWKKALEQRPDGESVLRPVIEEAERRLAAGVPPPAHESAHPEAAPQGDAVAVAGGAAPASSSAAAAPSGVDSPPGSAAPAPGGAAASAPRSDGSIRIHVELSPAAKERADQGGILFVTARPAGVDAGPPAAAKRVPASTFPVELTLGPGDSMMGQPFPSPARIEVRLDRDGDAATREPDEPRAHADGIEPGAAIQLVLQ